MLDGGPAFAHLGFLLSPGGPRSGVHGFKRDIIILPLVTFPFVYSAAVLFSVVGPVPYITASIPGPYTVGQRPQPTFKCNLDLDLIDPPPENYTFWIGDYGPGRFDTNEITLHQLVRQSWTLCYGETVYGWTPRSQRFEVTYVTT